MDHLDIRQRFPTLRDQGLAVEFFSDYRRPPALSPHTHAHLELCWVRQGRALSVIDGKEFILEPGTLSIINYGQSHDIRNGPERLDLVNVYLDAGLFPFPVLPEGIAEWLIPVFPLHPAFVHARNRILLVPLGDLTTVGTLLELLHAEQEGRRTGFESAMVWLFSQFLLACGRSIRDLAESGGEANDLARQAISQLSNPLEKIRLQIDRHPERSFSLAELSERYGLSPAHLCRSFKRHTGQTLVEYQRHRRVEMAVFWLRTSRMKVIEIAQNCGFNDLSHFNRSFRAVMGQSPRDYRAFNPRSGAIAAEPSVPGP